MKDNQFDLFLKNSLPDLPPEDVVNKVNPWRRFVFYIIIGLILSTTRLIGIKYLSFIVPTIGNIFLVQGFQGLRRENRFFNMGWIFSLICFIVMPILRINPRSFKIGEDSSVLILFVILFAVAFYSQFRCLALGITQIQEKCGVATNDKLKRIILGCSTALVFLNIVSNKPTWVSYFIPVVYLILVWCVLLLMREINEIGYTIHIAPMIISNKMIVLLTVLLMGGAFLFGEFMISPEPKNQTEWHVSDSGDLEIIAEFTFPKNGQQKRGYISYDAVSINGKSKPVNSWIKYVHQTSYFISPVQTAGQYWRNRRFNDGKNEDNFLIFDTAIHN